MLYKNILVAFDGSDPAKYAVEVAKGMIGDKSDATMHVVSVVPIGSLGTGTDSTVAINPSVQQFFPDAGIYDAAIETARAVGIEKINAAIADQIADVECNVIAEAVVSVKPAEGICEYVEDHNCDMIVMGRRGLGAFRSMLGSVSYAVVHEVSVPVVLVSK